MSFHPPLPLSSNLTHRSVRREDLNSSDASSASDNEDDLKAREELEAQIARSLGIDVHSLVPPEPAQPKTTAQPEPVTGEAREDEEIEDAPEEYDFCLFGGSAAPTTTTKVILEHDEELKGDGAILTNRPSSYYLARKYTPEEKENFALAAVTPEQILASSARRQWSNELPWKVTHITCHVNRPPPGPGSSGEGEKRRRPGKKRRLALKVKERKKREKDEEKRRKKEEGKVREVEKEEHLKEKKKRLNRARKLKRREKAREEKRARGEVVNDDEGDGDSESE